MKKPNFVFTSTVYKYPYLLRSVYHIVQAQCYNSFSAKMIQIYNFYRLYVFFLFTENS